MKRIINITSLLSCILIISCSGQDSSKVSEDYPSIITENNLQSEYDYGKWVVYCSNYKQEKLFFYDDEAHGEAIGRWSPIYYNLILDDVKVISDTTFLKYSIYIRDTTRCFDARPYHFVNTVVFIKNPPQVYRLSTWYEGSFCLNLRRIIQNNNDEGLMQARNLLYPYSTVEKEFIKFIETSPDVVKYNKWLVDYKNSEKYSAFSKYVVL